jgi:hypothetical protein
MEQTNFTVNCVEDINRIDLVEYMAVLGLHPASIKGNQYRFFSPFRQEAFPTFIVERDTNMWREGSDFRRHNPFEFGIKHHSGTIGELIAAFTQVLSRKIEKKDPLQDPRPLAIDPATVVAKLPLRSHEIAHHLKNRRIPWDVARQFCIQVDLQGSGKIERTLAFQNSAGGYYIRNSSINRFLSPCGASFKDLKSQACAVFIDFENFLSYQGILQNQSHVLTNFLILHSPALAHKSHSVMEKHDEVHLFLPRNEAGMSITRDLCQASDKYRDRSQLYLNYQSLNDWIRHIGQTVIQPPADRAPRLKKSG